MEVAPQKHAAEELVTDDEKPAKVEKSLVKSPKNKKDFLG